MSDNPVPKDERSLRCWLRFSSRFLKLFFHVLRMGSPVWGSTFLLVVLLGIGFSVVENIDVYEALYCAFITAMTVGYGDITPVTRAGMAMSVMMGILGLITTGIVVALAVRAGSLAYGELDGSAAADKKPEKNDRP